MLKSARLILLWVAALSLFAGVGASSLTPNEQKLLSFISGNEVKRTATEICGDSYCGRKAGSPGEALAANYIASMFKNDRLSMVGGGSYLEPFNMRVCLVKSVYDVKATLSYAKSGRTVQQSYSYPHYYGRGGVKISAPVVYVGEGVTDGKTGRDDYKGLTVKGKVAVITASASSRDGASGSALARALNAYRHGAAATLIVGLRNPIDNAYGGFGLAGAIADFPCLSVRPETVSQMFPGGMSKGKRSVDSVTITVPAIYNPSQPTRNVLSYLPGVLEKEYVLLGAHFDHLGVDGGSMFRGADDNASGTAVMLEVAKAFARSGFKLRRSVIFAGWTAEECGLVGSNHFADNPPVPLNQLKAVLNVDMVGVGDRGKYETSGGAYFPKQYQLLGSSARDLGFNLLPNEIKGVSDHLAFSRRGIPSLLVYAAGKHPNMHTVKDRPELLDPVVLGNTAKMVALALYRLAQQP